MFARAAAIAALILFAGSPIAHADGQDDKYLAVLASQGITGDPSQLIAEGHTACNEYGTTALGGEVKVWEGRGLSDVQALNMLLDGVRVYCPEKTPAGPIS